MKRFKRLAALLTTVLLPTFLSGCGPSSTSNTSESLSSSEGNESSESSTSSATSTSFDPVTPPSFETTAIWLHYQRNDDKYSDWGIYTWPKTGSEAATLHQANGRDAYGAIYAIELSAISAEAESGGFGFIVKSPANDINSWSSKDPDGDRFIDCSVLEKADDVYHVYLKTNDKNVYSDADGHFPDILNYVRFDDEQTISVSATNPIDQISLYQNTDKILDKTLTPSSKSFSLTLPDGKSVDLGSSYRLALRFATDARTMTSAVSVTKLYSLESFDTAYTYSGSDLGAIVKDGKTTFKVWSPVSTAIELRIYDNGTPTSVSAEKGSDAYEAHPMVKGEKGVWSYEGSDALLGKYYTYAVTNASYDKKETADPYATACGVNGIRGYIADFSSADTTPDGWDSFAVAHPYDRKELTVYESHIADLTSSATWTGTPENAKLYSGFHESGTTYTSGETTVKTGFDHIKELGVNAVQILPIFDQANDETNPSFNWGYNPQNYNCLEGVYSSDPYDANVRIKEFRSLVLDYYNAGINIIMDVVYNHMNGALGSPFDVLVPGYYFRYTSDGALSNGSGCGNETASEMPMFRKFMIDSTAFWTSTYKLGGFRFDLMGLHDLETMNELVANLKTINPAITVYGEPWSGGSSTLSDSLSAKQANGNKYVGYGQFNDGMRDALIKGGLHTNTERGWATATSDDNGAGDIANIVKGLKGTTDSSGLIADPDKTTNYVTCHDNYTLYDRIYTLYQTRSCVKPMAMLANSVVFTSQGTTFMLSGDEFCRTKGMNSNSYNSSYKVNEINWKLKVTNFSYFSNYVKLISLKQTVDGLHLGKEAAGNEAITTSNSNQIVMEVKDSALSRTYKIVHANGIGSARDAVDFSGYTLYLDTLGTVSELTSATPISKYQTIIAYK